MKVFLPESAKKIGGKFHPRHFLRLAEGFFGITPEADWSCISDAASIVVIRAPTSYVFSAELSQPKHGHAPVFSLLSDAEIAIIRGGQIPILFDMGWEMLNPTPQVIQSIAEGSSAAGIPASQISILHSNQNATPRIQALWPDFSTEAAFQSLEYPTGMALLVLHQSLYSDPEARARVEAGAIDALQPGGKPKLFNCFNGEVRPHRLLILSALRAAGLFKQGFVSVLNHKKGKEKDRDTAASDVLRIMRKLAPGDLYTADAKFILDNLPFSLDLNEIAPRDLETVAWSSQNTDYYARSSVSVVIDTIISNDLDVFVTEKVLKPIMNLSPFLLIGSAGSKQLLEHYGFDTFAPLIDQPSSIGTDILSVCHSVIEQLVRLNAMSPDARLDFDRSLHIRCRSNYDHFWNTFPSRLKQDFREDVMEMVRRKPQ